MRRVRWPVAIAAALILAGGALTAAREGLDAASVLLALGAVLIGAWIALEARHDD